jgi:hypothetical protein
MHILPGICLFDTLNPGSGQHTSVACAPSSNARPLEECGLLCRAAVEVYLCSMSLHQAAHPLAIQLPRGTSTHTYKC